MILSWVDWIIVSVVAVSCLFGLRRGLLKEALSVANWIIALLIAVTFRDQLAHLLVDHISTQSLREVTAFGTLFVATLLVGGLVNYLIGELVRMTGLSSTDRILGMVFGLMRGMVVIMAVVLLIPPIISIDQDQWWADSSLIPHFQSFEEGARAVTAEIVVWVGHLFSGTR